MTLHQLRIVLSIAKHRSMTKASVEHHISQPSVSQQIKLLEQEYGVKLYVKNGNGIEFTPAGQKFIDSAKQILLQVEKLEKDCKETLSHSNGSSLTIGGGYFASVTYLPLVLNAFKKTYPKVKLFLESEATVRIEELVLKSKVDVAVTVKPIDHPSIVCEPYREEQQVAVVSANHPLARKGQLTPKELAEVPFVIRHTKTRPSITLNRLCNEMGRQGLAMNIGLECDTPEGARAAVKSGIGLGFFFQELVERDIKRGRLKVIEIPWLKFDWKIKTYIVYQKDRISSPYVKEFLTLLRQWARKTALVDASLLARPVRSYYWSDNFTKG